MRRMLKWAARVLLVLMAAVIGLAGYVYVRTNRQMAQLYDVRVPTVAIPTDAESIERGEYIATRVSMCTECHGRDLGGAIVEESLAMGRFAAPNLTRGRGGIGARYTNEDLIRSLLHGVRPDRRSVVFMPSSDFQFTEADLSGVNLTGADPVGATIERWSAFRNAAPGFPLTTLGRQVHGTEVAWHEGGRGWLLLDAVDGHATTAPGILLTATVADCTPVYLLDPESGALALLHAGWRGASARILERGVRLLAGRAGAMVENLVMHCGVGICGDCYEVGSEVFEAFGQPVPPQGKGPLDVRGRLVEQATALGIVRVTVSPWCSAHDADRFHSHRRSGGTDGRMVAYLGRPLENGRG